MMTLWDRYTDGIDWASLAKGASSGFSVLVVGGLAAPLTSGIPLIGPPWLIITAMLAFMVAGWRIGDATAPAVHGASAAVASYLLVLPLVTLANRGIDLQQLALTTVAAIAAGAVAGTVAARRRSPERAG